MMGEDTNRLTDSGRGRGDAVKALDSARGRGGATDRGFGSSIITPKSERVRGFGTSIVVERPQKTTESTTEKTTESTTEKTTKKTTRWNESDVIDLDKFDLSKISQIKCKESKIIGLSNHIDKLSQLNLNQLEMVYNIILKTRGALTSYKRDEIIFKCGSSLCTMVWNKIPIMKTLEELENALDFATDFTRLNANAVNLLNMTTACRKKDTLKRGEYDVHAMDRVERLISSLEDLQDTGEVKAPPKPPTRKEDFIPREEINRLLTTSLLPSISELVSERKSSNLLANRVDKPWKSDDPRELALYRLTHSDLLREDYVAPLREAVLDMLMPEKASKYSAPVFGGVKFHSFEKSSSHKLCVYLTWNSVSKRIDMTTGKKFLFGSLLLLIKMREQMGRGSIDLKDRVESITFATVHTVNTNSSDGSTGSILVEFSTNCFAELDERADYLMIESPVFFAAVRPVIRALKDPDFFRNQCLLKYLLQGNTDRRRVRPPSYLNCQINLGPLYKEHVGDIEGDPLGEWPCQSSLELDKSQQEALKSALAQPVACIQGPPGTGKSYIGVKFIRLAVQANKGGRILAVTYTNHALDQLLNDLKVADPSISICRFGGKGYEQEHPLFDCHIKVKMDEDRMSRRMLGARNRYRGRRRRRCRGYSSDDGGFNVYRWESKQKAMLFQEIEELTSDLLKQMAMSGVLSKLLILCALPEEDAVAILQPPGWEIPIFLLGNKWIGIALYMLDAWFGDRIKHVVKQQRTLMKTVIPPKTKQNQVLSASKNPFEALVEMKTDPPKDILCGFTDEQLLEQCRITENGASNFIKKSVQDLLSTTTMSSLFEDSNLDLDFQEETLEREMHINDGDSSNKDSDNDSDCDSVSGVSQSGSETEAIYREDLESPEASCKFLLRQLRSAVEKVDSNQTLLNKCQTALRPLLGTSRRLAEVPRIGERVNNAIRDTLISEMKLKKLHILAQVDQATRNLEGYRKQAWRRCAQVDVVGMTSTFAATNREFVNSLGARVVIAEEVGELLEAQLMACLGSKSLEHVVMIGDHKQLRPKVNHYELELNKNFHISLFERLVKLGHPVASLETQLRMRPEVARLVEPFYKSLLNHERVLRYPNVLGVRANVYFLSHSFPEDTCLSGSKKNIFEARYCTRLAKYILHQCQYKAEEITIITPYRGQMMLLRKHTGETLKDAKVVTVDEYQGEENKVVILSLVRCNPMNKTGFVSIQNRLIVALSRAKHGLFIVGNADLLASHGKDWNIVIRRLIEANAVGTSLPLGCQQHPDMTAVAASAEDFDRVAPLGGCTRWCNRIMETCGHVCPKLCHNFSHEEVSCEKKCSRPRPDGCSHTCENKCHKCYRLGSTPTTICPTKCKVLTMVPIPLPCTHQPDFPCHEITSNTMNCYIPLDITLKCGHKMRVKCADKANQSLRCMVKVDFPLSCGHSKVVECAETENYKSISCNHTETATGTCGHPCSVLCTTLQPCTHLCNTKLPCGHQCLEICGTDHSHAKVVCKALTKVVRLSCKHQSVYPCHQVTSKSLPQCTAKVSVPLRCGHSNLVGCSVIKNSEPISCTHRCEEKLPCGHQCPILCGTPHKHITGRRIRCGACYAKLHNIQGVSRFRKYLEYLE
eukprot:GHVR01045534.1.p1 GENE.GHVR01045534.1~~GHVR01045534.1.p1  ORF type:complete len:1618 (+),score=201.19 GHVR01045534.1:20-4873(+)